MGKFRPRVKGKGKRWKKGQSSSSNPEIKRHRDVAKSRFFQVQENAGKGDLTSDAIRKHNAFLGDKMETSQAMDENDENHDGSFAGSYKTFQTFASDWSLCSNQSFSKLLHGFRSDSALHKEMLAVLAAVTEVIKQNGGTESVTEYFGALMTTLDVSESEDSLAAVLSLLGMGIKSVPQNIIQAKFPQTSKCLVELLGKFSESDNNVILRSLIGCLSVLLRAQEAAVWSHNSTVQVFDSLLAFTTHSKPKVRKAAQHAICAVLKGSAIMREEATAPAHHPGAAHAAGFCVRQIEAGGALGGSTTTLHVLGLLKEVLATFPKAQLKAACECILKVMTLGNVLITSCGMQALHGLFASRPPPTSLPPPLNAQLVTALHDYQPAPNDTQPTLAWLAVMQEAYINLAKQNLTLAVAHLPRLFAAASQLWLSEKAEVTNGATRCLLAATHDCVAPACATRPLAEQHKATLKALAKTVLDGLQYQFHSAWPQVLHLMAAFFEVAGGTCSGMLKPSLKALAELRDSYQFSYAHEAEKAICKAVKAMGPEAVLEMIPLQITGEETSYEFPRSWLLPVLREGVSRTSLGFFVSRLLPLATACRRSGLAAAARADMVGAHSYDLLQAQVWALLPSFADRPTDLQESFKTVAKVLGSAIRERPDLRISVLAALRRLVSCSRDRAAEGEPGDRDEVARFAKNFLPILFNVYTTRAVGSDQEGQRLAAYETAKLYLSITDSALCWELFDKAMAKYEAEGCEAFVQESVLDLLRALLPRQDRARLERLYALCEAGVYSSRNHHVQKKAYRMFEDMCASDSDICRQFVSEKLPEMQNILLKSLSKSATSSKGPRLRCLLHVVRRLDRAQLDVLQRVVPEAVLCCKDLNEKCRSAAFTLLVQVGSVMAAWADKPPDDIMRDYLGLVLAGLAGSPTLASATVLALAKITYEFRETLPEDLLILMLDNICILASSATREIVASCLSYIKVFITSFSVEAVGPSVPTIVKGMLCMTEDCKRYLRNKYRNIFDRLVRKFGWKPISDLVPATDTIMHKRLKNLRKQQEKKKKVREQDRDPDSDADDFLVKARQKSIDEILAESDDDDDDPKEHRPTKAKKNPSAWIREDADDIVDFTDVSATKQIRATNPAGSGSGDVRKVRASGSGIRTAPDGRLIIVDDGDDSGDEEGKATKQKWRNNASDDESDTEMATQPGGKRKRRNSGGSTNVPSEPSMKYQAGGSGIHRPIRKSKSKGPAASSTGEEYKSTKAFGDVKRKGRPDPFAYVPMSRKMLNKRKKGKPSGQFTNLVRKGHKGGKVKGKKGKSQ